MGLRINTNVSALTALRTLRANDVNQSRSLERLATGLRINRASDDPSGLVISEQLRNQLSALGQAVENSTNSSNLISTADAALQEISDILTDVQASVVFALNTGGSSPEQIAAEQAGVDQAIASIDRIASTTRFSDRSLLNGTADFSLVGPRPQQMQDLKIRSAFIVGDAAETKDFDVSVRELMQRATVRLFSVSAVTSGTTLRITGPRGTEQVQILATLGASGANSVADAINSVAGFTGVYAVVSGTSFRSVYVRSEDYGVNQQVRLEVTAGFISGANAAVETLTGGQLVGTSGAVYTAAAGVAGGLGVGDIATDDGRNAVVEFQGVEFEGVGRKFSILSRSAQFEFGLTPTRDLGSGVAINGTSGTSIVLGSPITFTVGNRGLNFQLNELPQPTDRIQVGLEPMNTSFLGFEAIRDKISEAIAGAGALASADAGDGAIFKGGFLNTLRTGGGNDLFTNAGNASEIVKASANQVARLRGYLGAVQADAIEPNITSLSVHIENLTSSLSSIRDLDFASETANFTRTQILFQSGIAVLASANLIPQSVLTLLG